MLTSWKLPFFKGKTRAGVIMGESCSGKTTLLYTLKGYPDALTIPTIGFNVEDCTVQDGSGCQVTLWDIGGGCGRMQPLFKYYLTAEKFCIFLHNVGDDFLAEESYEGFRLILKDYSDQGGRHIWVVMTKQDLLETEEERTTQVAAAKDRLSAVAAPFIDRVRVRFLALPNFSAKEQGGANEMLSMVRKGLQEDEESKKVTQKAGTVTSAASITASEADLRAAVEQALESVRQQPAEAFWQSFLDGTLRSWDHAAHLRAGLGVILHGYLQPGGLFAWTDTFISHLERLRQGRPDLFRNTAHRTMTMFWLHRLHGALRRRMAAAEAPGAAVQLPRLDVFPQLLQDDVHLMDRNLWRQSYSQTLMFSPGAKEAWCLPDMAMLPDTIVQPGRLSGSPQTSTDDILRLPRFAFAVVKKTFTSGARRGGIVRLALTALQRVTMQKRAAAATSKAGGLPPPPPYSETQAYFWIQYVHACLRVLDGPRPGVVVPYGGSLQALRFEAFAAMFALRGDEWTRFYSAARWSDMGARTQMVLPDRQPLPNVFPAPEGGRVDKATSVLVQEVADEEAADASEEELAFYAEVVVEEGESDGGDEDGSDQDKDKDDATLVNPTDYCTTTRGRLLRFIFRGLSEALAGSAAELSAASMAVAESLQSETCQAGGVTQAFFWVRFVLAALMQERQAKAKTREDCQEQHRPDGSPSWLTAFAAFVRRHPKLAWDDLSFAYYSPAVWKSAEAQATIVVPDRQALPGAMDATRTTTDT